MKSSLYLEQHQKLMRSILSRDQSSEIGSFDSFCVILLTNDTTSFIKLEIMSTWSFKSLQMMPIIPNIQ